MLPRRDKLQHRLADTKGSSAGPLTYNKADHSVEAVISMAGALRPTHPCSRAWSMPG